MLGIVLQQIVDAARRGKAGGIGGPHLGDVGDISVGWSLSFIAAFLALCLGLIVAIFRTGYRLKN